MKKSIIYIFVALLGFTACEEQLDLSPVSSIGEEGYFTNEEEIDAGIVGVYDALQEAVKREFVLCEIRSDNTTTLEHEGDFDAIDNFVEGATNSITTLYWQQQYTAIARANKVLKNIANSSDVAQEAELRFLRAYSHFNLVRLFGPVPLVNEEVAFNATEKFKNSTVDALYSFIETELKFAAENLPATRSGDVLGRATSMAAKAMLAQAYMAQGEDAAALPLLDEVIGTYNFAIAYNDVFSINNEMNDEIVFAIRFATGVGEGQDIGREFTATGEFSGLNNPTAELVNLYEVGDLRKAFNISTDATPLAMKYAEDNSNDSEMDWVVIRKAETLLSRAEITAKADAGVSQSAIDDINLLRTRAGLSTYTTADFASKNELVTAIENERRVELAFENYRWFDLLRTGNATATMGTHLGTSVDAKYALFPIPQSEIDASQGQLSQNR